MLGLLSAWGLPLLILFLFTLIAPFFWAYILAKRSKKLFTRILCFILIAFGTLTIITMMRPKLPQGGKEWWNIYFGIYFCLCFFSYGVGAIILKQRTKKLTIQFIIIVILIYLSTLIFMIESLHRIGSINNCENSRMIKISSEIREYVESHDGFFPTHNTPKIWEPKVSLFDIPKDNSYTKFHSNDKSVTCPVLNNPYQWTKKQYTINDNPNLMIVWDGKPHGFISKWRNVVFIRNIKDRGWWSEKVPERKFQKLLKEQQGGNKR